MLNYDLSISSASWWTENCNLPQWHLNSFYNFLTLLDFIRWLFLKTSQPAEGFDGSPVGETMPLPSLPWCSSTCVCVQRRLRADRQGSCQQHLCGQDCERGADPAQGVGCRAQWHCRLHPTACAACHLPRAPRRGGGGCPVPQDLADSPGRWVASAVWVSSHSMGHQAQQN